MFAESAREALAEQDVADVLIFQLKRSPDAERRHVVLEILGSLGESGKMAMVKMEIKVESKGYIQLSPSDSIQNNIQLEELIPVESKKSLVKEFIK